MPERPISSAFTLGPWRKFSGVSVLLLYILLITTVLYLFHFTPESCGSRHSNPCPYEPTIYNVPFVRPPQSQRKFTSPAVEEFIVHVTGKMRDGDLKTLLENCLPNTLDTTVEWFDVDNSSSSHDPRAFLITGDIPAMWIRDSTNQISPYASIAKKDPRLQRLILGVLNVQATYLYYDPYANAFLRPWDAPKQDERYGADDRVIPNYDATYVWESKYELDSIANFFQLANNYIQATQDYEGVFLSSEWLKAVPRVLIVLHDQMKDGYRFRRTTERPTETLGENGRGGIARECGLVKSAFRPSDDATTFPYLIPANAQLAVQLQMLSDHLQHVPHLLTPLLIDIEQRTRKLSQTVRTAIEKHGIVEHPTFGRIYAFEVDCYGSYLLMDDANMPSLLSLPILGYVSRTNTVYQATRAFVLSLNNPWYFEGTFASGVGGPHTGQDMIWPMSLLVRIQTSVDEVEIRHVLDEVKRWSARTGLMCESFDKNEPSQFTRPWFSWANGLAGTTIIYLLDHYPHLV
ncbi:glycoside hydrolase family 125 protein [Phycomyces blakesleeanus NRRL 1555(-)]|uniref:Glycoside hydrolase family 125 protein n=1 Tax=Phycomyces blakesleeanus (strain ATCC 8743b / DSM 1359 / FGSC 10004 / NBRC 33097 / NRRL 1555) TaxID=763407 RepID=A0A163ABC4_PHYB8|nr:glycoside hydrolase family 125 protein [Phycomyces blakesleeanus NRRL 1555(-)]OAD72321.1 glycoside hydrolase family 125 protein [Phycomyces blakesleeanus NRRL 1555(-)]|eukprot:XP_018290361.1 glycoside hydrolase family 125 protein [Phycomyces blakesleeanus NRRL 1555(-)]